MTAQPDAQVILFETFARRASHPYYPGMFTDPADMQAQLRFHHDDCANNFPAREIGNTASPHTAPS